MRTMVFYSPKFILRETFQNTLLKMRCTTVWYSLPSLQRPQSWRGSPCCRGRQVAPDSHRRVCSEIQLPVKESRRNAPFALDGTIWGRHTPIPCSLLRTNLTTVHFQRQTLHGFMKERPPWVRYIRIYTLITPHSQTAKVLCIEAPMCSQKKKQITGSLCLVLTSNWKV